MKTKTLVIIIFCVLVLFASRNFIKDEVIPFFFGEDSDFSLNELINLGILDNENTLESLGHFADNDNDFSMSDIDINSLNLSALSDEQLGMLMRVISKDMTMTELIKSGEFTLQDLKDVGLFDVIMDNLSNTNEEE